MTSVANCRRNQGAKNDIRAKNDMSAKLGAKNDICREQEMTLGAKNDIGAENDIETGQPGAKNDIRAENDTRAVKQDSWEPKMSSEHKSSETG